jgi:hypothetical protein
MRRFFARLTKWRSARRERPSSRPALEGLEDRTVPTVTFHGGAVLQNVKVQALFLGGQWQKDPALTAQAQYLSGALGSIVNSSYMDALTGAGYGVGRGTVAPSVIDRAPNLDGILNDSSSFLRKELTDEITNRWLQFPTTNTLYVCFVDPYDSALQNAATKAPFYGPTSHGSFQLRQPDVATPGGIPPVRYALINYPVGNSGVPFLSTLDSLTTTLSREVADAVTDPDLGYYDPANPKATRPLGWSDNRAGDIGDVVTNRVMYVNGYALQRVVNQQDFVMTPATATSNRAVNFVLQADGTLVEVVRGGPTTVLMAGVAAVSDQGIDNQGHALVDIVTTDGRAFKFHDTGAAGALISLGSGIKSAKAGQGVSYILYNSGDVYEYNDATGGYYRVTNSAAQIDAGTDAQGVNAVDVIFPGAGAFSQVAYQYSDDSGAHFIARFVKSISAGRQGLSAYVTTGGEARTYSQAGNSYADGASGVSQVTAGADEIGKWLVEMLLTNGTLEEFGASRGLYSVAGGVRSVSKARLGAVDLVLTARLVNTMASPSVVGAGGGVVVGSPPVAWEHTAGGWRHLGDNAAAAV